MDNLALLVILAIDVKHDHWNAEDEKANDHEKQECSDSFDRLLNQKHVVIDCQVLVEGIKTIPFLNG